MTTGLNPLHSLLRHIRRCCVAFVDGELVRSWRSPRFLLARVSPDAGYWCYPVITAAVVRNCAEMGIDINTEILGLHGVEQLYAFLNRVEKPLIRLLAQQDLGKKEAIIEKNFEAEPYQEPRVNLLPSMFKPVQEAGLPGVSLYLHGSMADRSYTSFSDVDDLVVLRKQSWQDLRGLSRMGTMLTKLCREYQSLDPLQHHGHWVVTEFDLLSYDPSYMPLVVLQGAKKIVGDNRVEFCVRENPRGFAENAAATIGAIYHRLEQAARRGGLNAYYLKRLVGEIAILPAYIYQSMGEMISKAAAIKEAEAKYSPFGYQAVKWATMVRQEFDICVDNPRTRALQNWATHYALRRQQAEQLFKRFSSWINNDHKLGLNPKVREYIRTFARESESLNPYVASLCRGKTR